MAISRTLVRLYKRMLATRGKVAAEVPEIRTIRVRPFVREKEMTNQIEELIKRHKQTALPTELRAEMNAYTQMAIEAINVYNNWVDIITMERTPLSVGGLNALMKLSQHIHDLTKKIQKRATYLKEPMPELPAMKPLPLTITGPYG